MRILLKEIRHTSRDWLANSLMILFPIVLMSVLGAALSGVFTSSLDVDARVMYTIRARGPLGAAFEGFRATAETLGVRFSPTDNPEAGMQATREATHSAYVVVTDDGLTLYRNDRFAFEAGFVQTLLAAFMERYTALLAIAQAAPSALPQALAAEPVSYTESTALAGDRQPRAVDYYAVTMLTFITLYSSMLGMMAIRKEQRLRTSSRILCAPVRRWQLLTGKVAGVLVVTSVQIVVVMLFSRYVLGAYWGGDVAAVALVLLANAVMAVSIGAGVAYLIPNEGAATGLLNTIIPVLAWFGGGYVPLEVLGPAMSRIALADPVGWANRALLGVIYRGDYAAVVPSILISLGVAAAFLVPAALLSRKEA
jgi:ABC-2 type transport system permease protein